MKLTIEQHEECLRTMRRVFDETYSELQTIMQRMESERKGIMFYEHQIETAKAEGRNSFDASRYLKRRDA